MTSRTQRLIELCVSLGLTGGLLAVAAFYQPKVAPPPISQPAQVPTDRYYGITAVQGNTWVVGDGGKVLHSIDGGDNWTVQRGYGHPDLQAVAAWDAKQIIAVGNDNQIIRSEDGGLNWSSVREVPKSQWNNKLLQVHLDASGTAWAVGAGGAILRSADVGKHWEAMVEMEDITWHGVSSCDHGRQLMVVGEFGQILSSIDAGTTWVTMPSATDITLTSIGLDNACQGLAVGLQGTVLRLFNGRWQPFELPGMQDATASLHWFAVATADNRWWITGEHGALIQIDLPEPTTGLAQTQRLETGSSAAWFTDIQAAGDKLLVVGDAIVSAIPDTSSLISRR